MYGEKIRMFRLLRGFDQNYMANKLDISQNAYSRMETNITKKISDDVLSKIAEVLGISIVDLQSQMPIIIQNHQSNLGTQGNGNTINFYESQKELMDKLLASKDALIKNQEAEIKALKSKTRK